MARLIVFALLLVSTARAVFDDPHSVAEDINHRYQDLYNQKDWEALAHLFTPGAVVTNERYIAKGQHNILKAYKSYKFPRTLSLVEFNIDSIYVNPHNTSFIAEVTYSFKGKGNEMLIHQTIDDGRFARFHYIQSKKLINV